MPVLYKIFLFLPILIPFYERIFDNYCRLFLMACFEETKAASSKIDTVYLQHGDRLTGELVSLNKGILKLKTNDVGTVSIEWQNVDSLCILNPLRILKHNGGIFSF